MMNGLKKYFGFLVLGSIVLLSSCEDFFNPDLGNVVDKDDYFKQWEDFRSAELGLYALQQELVEQIVVLGELRADLMEVTPNADRDLIEVYNFAVSPENKYASPVNFYKLIGACNSLKNELERFYPSVLDMSAEITRYDRMYGEVLTMRAWAYFNAARIYNKVPYIWSSLTSLNEIDEYLNSPQTYVDSLYIVYNADGYNNDTIQDTTIVLDKAFLTMKAVIDTFTHELENKVKSVGVIHNQDFNDQTWDITIWNDQAAAALLGQMYFFDQNYEKANEYFEPIVLAQSELPNNAFYFNSWRNILTQISTGEHLFTLWFNKSFQQRNNFQQLFSQVFPHKYMLKPTELAVQNWEGIWAGFQMIRNDNNPQDTRLRLDAQGNPQRGIPGDFNRGHGVSYAYFKKGETQPMDNATVREMLVNKAEGNVNLVDVVMEDVDTVLYKYTINKQPYDQDASFMVLRASSIYLYYAEMFVRRVFLDNQGKQIKNINLSVSTVNEAIRSRVGFASGEAALYVRNIVYRHDPITNEVIGFSSLPLERQKQNYLEDKILEERARELAYEGERFYDLMRVAKRRNDPSYLADKVASKFSGAKKEEIRQLLMNEENWYIPLFND